MIPHSGKEIPTQQTTKITASIQYAKRLIYSVNSYPFPHKIPIHVFGDLYFHNISRHDTLTGRKKDLPVELENAEKVNVIQPTLWESEAGNIHALVRSNIGRIYRSDSKDYGETWSPIYPTDMPNNNSGIDCVKLSDGRIVLICNPIEKNWGPRTPLSVFVSEDNGVSFKKELDLETEEGGFAYPSVIELGGILHIVYTYNRKKIVCAEIEL